MPVAGSEKATRVPCPTCGAAVPWSAEASPWRPFCSERCRLLDLGAWFTGDRAIPGEDKDRVPPADETSAFPGDRE
ncbi:MAG: DNA gyrase inhibitor YacG [Gammaproteobacteria bacterium]|jgi:hypothetical protein